jgi:hypothetical protein
VISYACNLLGSSNSGATCEPIGGNGTSGVYGDLSYCSPAIKLSYVFSAYYEFNPVDTSCDFDGNATLSNNRMLPIHRCRTHTDKQDPTRLKTPQQPHHHVSHKNPQEASSPHPQLPLSQAQLLHPPRGPVEQVDPADQVALVNLPMPL